MAPIWIDSPLVSLPGVDPISGLLTQDMIISFVGYVGEPDGSLPSRDVPYVCRVVVGVANPSEEGNVRVETGVFLPPNTSFASQPAIACRLNRAGQSQDDVTQDPLAACGLSPTQYPNGAANLGQRLLPSYHIFEMRFTVVTTGPIQGTLKGYVSSFFGEMLPEVPLTVGVQGTFPMSPSPPPSAGRLDEWKIAFIAMSPQGFPDYPPEPLQEPVFLPKPPGIRSVGTIQETYRGLVAAAHFATHPSWSPDGTQIAYADLDATTGRFQIFVVGANGANRRRLTTVPPLDTMHCQYPKWSADGSRIMMQATRSSAAAPGTDDSFWQIYTVRAADGTDPRPFTAGASQKTFPVFSRSSRPGIDAVVFLNNGVVMSVDADEANLRQISSDAGSQRRFLAASRRHNWIAFNETPIGSSAADLIVMNTATGVSRRVNGGVSPAFTPDGNWIASNVPWLVSIDGTNLFVSMWQYGDDQLDWA